MRRILIAIGAAAFLSGCAAPPKERLWVRTDGREAKGDPALATQYQIDARICMGTAQQANLSAGTNPLGGFAGAIEQGRRNEAAVAVAEGCMAQKGYLRVDADQAAATAEELRKTAAARAALAAKTPK